MYTIKELSKIYKGKKILMTGHTGFKGAYACVLLKYLGAKVYGYSLKEDKGSLYDIFKKELSDGKKNASPIDGECYADIRDYKKLKSYMMKVKPDFVFHMAAQPLVFRGYKEPLYTYEVNVMGTANLLEAVNEVFANSKKVISVLNVTTDKVYENNDLSNYAFKENDKLCGRDPYANSKSCSELVTYAYKKSYFENTNIRISTCRAGNVIGGGDMNENRIIPDAYRAIKYKKNMEVRNPVSVRPYQFVLEPLIMYLNIMAYQFKNKKYEGNYNVGPDKKSCLYTKDLVEKFYKAWEGTGSPINCIGHPINCIGHPINCIGHPINRTGRPVADIIDARRASSTSQLINRTGRPVADENLVALPRVIYGKVKNAKHEAAFLRLDNSLIKKVFGYKEIYDMNTTMRYTADVYKLILDKEPILPYIINICRTGRPVADEFLYTDE